MGQKVSHTVLRVGVIKVGFQMVANKTYSIT